MRAPSRWVARPCSATAVASSIRATDWTMPSLVFSATDDLGAGEMGILGLHRIGDGGVGEPIGQHRYDLRLDAAEYGAPPPSQP